MTESTHDWRRTYTTPNGAPGKDLIDPKCTDDLSDMAHAYLESGYGEVYWPAKGCASPRGVPSPRVPPEYPKDLNKIVDNLALLFWLQNKHEAHNSKRYINNSCDEDSDSGNRDSTVQFLKASTRPSSVSLYTHLMPQRSATVVSTNHEPKTTYTSPTQRNEASNQGVNHNGGLPADYVQQWKAIIPLPSSLADSNTSSETETENYEDSDYSESQQPHPTEKSRDHWDVPDDRDKELTRKKPSRFERLRSPASDTQESAALKNKRRQGDWVSPPITITRRRVETEGFKDNDRDEERRHLKRKRGASARMGVSCNDSAPSRNDLRSHCSDVQDKDDESRIVNSVERPGGVLPSTLSRHNQSSQFNETHGGSRISPTNMSAPRSAEILEQGLSVLGQSSDNNKPISRSESLEVLWSQAKKPQAASISDPGAPQLSLQQSNIPSIALHSQVHTAETRPLLDQGVPVNARVPQLRIRFMIVTHVPRDERYWRKGTFDDRSLEDFFAGVSECFHKKNIQKIWFILWTKFRGKSTFLIENDDHAGFEYMKEAFFNYMRKDDKNGATHFGIKLGLDPEPDDVEDIFAR
ncbi:MAG: hypothetical protein ASARMPREDX12_000749 [Alectoria sarmentosa]|nr:MAG: hypothetical protein ASARMPREDX12_000749 [Alectoria sarmentosa]